MALRAKYDRRVGTGRATAMMGSSVLFRYRVGDSLTGATFTRVGPATYVDALGVRQTAASGVVRDAAYSGGVRRLLLERSRTNSLLNSTAPETQVLSLTAGTYTLWVEGTGTCTLSGGPAGVAAAGAPVTFVLAATTNVTFTVAGALSIFQCETGAYPTSFIATVAVAVTRQEDVLFLPFGAPPQEMTIYTRHIERGSAQTTNGYLWGISNSGGQTPAIEITTNSGRYRLNAGGSVVSTLPAPGPVIGDDVELRSILYANGDVQLAQSLNGAAEVVASRHGTLAMPSAWSAKSFYLNSLGNNVNGAAAFRVAVIAPGVRSLAEMRRLA